METTTTTGCLMGEVAEARGGAGPCGFATHVIGGRWFSLFATFLIMVGAGATYLFGIYSKEIKASLGYDQTTLNLLGFFKDLGANVGVFSGLIAEVTPTWFVLLVGSSMNFAGYFMIWLAVTGKIPTPKVWHMCIYICIGANSQNFANTGALVTAVKNFPARRGIMLGLLKGFVGLSGAIMTQIYLAIYGDDSKSLILLIAWLPAAISVVFVYTIRPMKISRCRREELKVLYRFLYVSIFLALFLMLMNIIEKLVEFNRAAYAGSAAVVCALLFLPLAIAVREELDLFKLEKQNSSSCISNSVITIEKPVVLSTSLASIPPIINNGLKLEELGSKKPSFPTLSLEEEKTRKKSSSWWSNIVEKPNRGEDYTIIQAILSVDMLFLFVSTLCGLGSSFTAVDNLGQIGESLGYPSRTVSSFVSLVSIWNYFGRVFAGFVSETLISNFKFPRPLMMTLVLLLSCIGNLMIAFPFPGAVYIASVIIGFSFGAQLTLSFTIISELFGLKYYATLFNCGQLASPLGSYILNVRVTGMLYDKEAAKALAAEGMRRAVSKELTCIGKQCYRLSFVVLASVTLFGAAASVILVMRTREFYRGDIYKRFREEAEAAETEMVSSSSDSGRH